MCLWQVTTRSTRSIWRSSISQNFPLHTCSLIFGIGTACKMLLLSAGMPGFMVLTKLSIYDVICSTAYSNLRSSSVERSCSACGAFCSMNMGASMMLPLKTEPEICGSKDIHIKIFHELDDALMKKTICNGCVCKCSARQRILVSRAKYLKRVCLANLPSSYRNKCLKLLTTVTAHCLGTRKSASPVGKRVRKAHDM